MGWLMEPIYTAISWILLKWHWVWNAILPDGTFLGTTWDWVLAVVFLVITVRVILFPIFVKQIRSQRAMQALQPKVKELQAKYKGDNQTLREEMMKLYQTEKVNPLMGCLPLLLQIPVFFGLFHVLKGLNPANPATRELYGWTGAQWDDAVLARLFNAPLPAHFSSNAAELTNLNASGVTVMIVSGILVLIMMLTTFMTSRQMILKTGWSQDPQQRMIQRLMLYGIPFSLLLSGWYFPIGVIIYWVTQNIFSLGQQFWVLHKYPPPVTENTPKKGEIEEVSFLKRFILAKPAPPKRPGAPTPLQAVRSSLLRRKTEDVAPTAAAPTARSLAPRVGAKPVKQASAATPEPEETESTPPPSNGAPTGASSGGKASVGKASSGKASAPESKATGAGTAKGSGTGGAAKTSANGASANGRSGGGGAARGKTPAKKVGAQRKGQPKKGGAKR